MPVERSKVVSEAAETAAPPGLGWWTPTLASYNPMALDQAQAHEATLAALRHWRTLTELQIAQANEAYRLAAVHAERRREALMQFIETVWPAPTGREERADV